MISKSKYFFAALITAIALPLTGFATEQTPVQEEGNTQEVQQEQEVKEDSTIVYEEDNRVNEPFMLEGQLQIPQEQDNLDRVNTSYSTTTVETEKVESEDDPNSAMSFNFIYYIIDKFKLADPMD